MAATQETATLALCILKCSDGHSDQEHPYLQETTDANKNFKPNIAVLLATTEQELEEGQVHILVPLAKVSSGNRNASSFGNGEPVGSEAW